MRARARTRALGWTRCYFWGNGVIWDGGEEGVEVLVGLAVGVGVRGRSHRKIAMLPAMNLLVQSVAFVLTVVVYRPVLSLYLFQGPSFQGPPLGNA